MAYNTSTYFGDNLHTINCTGDVVSGDRVCFERATFTGSFRNARFAGFERIEALVVNDSYGAVKQQHTFTLELADGTKSLVKGRNLYANGIWRQPWTNETDRQQAADEKHARGDAARKARDHRRNRPEGIGAY